VSSRHDRQAIKTTGEQQTLQTSSRDVRKDIKQVIQRLGKQHRRRKSGTDVEQGIETTDEQQV
jgi:hypothetical protein